MLEFALGVIIVLIILWHLGYIPGVLSIKPPTEGYLSCRDCSDYKPPKNGILVINPYVMPYSSGQFSYPSVPDHVEQTN